MGTAGFPTQPSKLDSVFTWSPDLVWFGLAYWLHSLCSLLCCDTAFIRSSVWNYLRRALILRTLGQRPKALPFQTHSSQVVLIFRPTCSMARQTDKATVLRVANVAFMVPTSSPLSKVFCLHHLVFFPVFFPPPHSHPLCNIRPGFPAFFSFFLS